MICELDEENISNIKSNLHFMAFRGELSSNLIGLFTTDLYNILINTQQI